MALCWQAADSFFSSPPSIWSLPERSSGIAPKIPNLRGKILLLFSLEEVAIKGEFVPFQPFSSSIHHF
uniref:Uncharacterized protein n=1 Tax=Setaria viridis TaxID=4556 RepID=A0A4U6V1C5_SETVI|nr:hypothetical protein SEVIR_4G092000v2 [Setaria viridis]